MFTSLLKDELKDMKEQPDEGIKRVRSESFWRARVSVPGKLGVCH